MTRVTRLILLLFTIFALLLTMIRTTAAPSDPVFAAAFQRDPTCPQPCWHGIQLGITSVDDAYNILHKENSFVIQIERPDENSIRWEFVALPEVRASAVHLDDRPGSAVQVLQVYLYTKHWGDIEQFTIADAVRIWGAPISSEVYACPNGSSKQVRLRFAGNIQALSYDIVGTRDSISNQSEIRIAPDLPLAFIHYSVDLNAGSVRPPRIWSGFRRWREQETKFLSACP